MSKDSQTEEPTDQKLREARKKGNMAKSRDLSMNVSLLAWCGLLAAGGGILVSACMALLHGITATDLGLPWNALWTQWATHIVVALAAGIVFPAVAGLLLGVIPELAQSRMELATKKPLISIESLNPVEGFKKLFSLRQLGVVVLSILRCICMGWVAYWLFRRGFQGLNALWQAHLLAQAGLLAKLVLKAAFLMGMVIIPLSAMDWMWQKKMWKRGLRMSKEEVKREFKDAEGDPHIKSQRKQLHMESVR
jgi:flagellar biosynthesis protein FlhB